MAGVKINIDGSPAVGGENAGARPMELLLMGIGSCAAIDIVSILKKQKFLGSLYDETKVSVKQLDELYRYFEIMGDHAGQHQVMVLALLEKNRSRCLGREAEADAFAQWLTDKWFAIFC